MSPRHVGDGLGGAGPFQEPRKRLSRVGPLEKLLFVQLGLFVKTAHNTSYLATYKVGSATRVLLALGAFARRGEQGKHRYSRTKGRITT